MNKPELQLVQPSRPQQFKHCIQLAGIASDNVMRKVAQFMEEELDFKTWYDDSMKNHDRIFTTRKIGEVKLLQINAFMRGVAHGINMERNAQG